MVACPRVVQGGSGCVHVRGSIGCGVQPTMLVLFDVCFLIVKPSFFLLGCLLLQHDVMDRVPIGTSVDDSSVAFARFETYGLSECVPSDTTEEKDAHSFCECVAVGSVIGGYIAMLHHLCWCSCAWCFDFCP